MPLQGEEKKAPVDEREEKKAPVDGGSKYRIDDRPDHLLVRRIDRPDTAWRVTTTELLGPHSYGSGLLVDFEALDGLARIGRMSIQWDPSFKAFRVNFASKSTTLGVQVFDVHAGSAYVAFDSTSGTHAVLFNPRTQETRGAVPESALITIKEVAPLFNELLEPLTKWVAREKSIASCLADRVDDDTSVIFQQVKDDKKEDCDRNRKVGWVKAGLEFLGGLWAAPFQVHGAR